MVSANPTRKRPRVIGSLERNEAQKTGWPQQQKTLQSGKLPPAYAVLINGMDIKLVYQVKGDEAKVHTVANQMGQMQMLWTPPKSSLSTGEKVTLDMCLPSTYVYHHYVWSTLATLPDCTIQAFVFKQTGFTRHMAT